VLVQVLPGDPAAYMMGLNASPDAVAALRAQFWSRCAGMAAVPSTGSPACCARLRPELHLPRVGRTLLAERLAVSLPLALYALALAVGLALPLGLAAAARRGHLD